MSNTGREYVLAMTLKKDFLKVVLMPINYSKEESKKDFPTIPVIFEWQKADSVENSFVILKDPLGTFTDHTKSHSHYDAFEFMCKWLKSHRLSSYMSNIVSFAFTLENTMDEDFVFILNTILGYLNNMANIDINMSGEFSEICPAKKLGKIDIDGDESKKLAAICSAIEEALKLLKSSMLSRQ